MVSKKDLRTFPNAGDADEQNSDCHDDRNRTSLNPYRSIGSQSVDGKNSYSYQNKNAELHPAGKVFKFLVHVMILPADNSAHIAHSLRLVHNELRNEIEAYGQKVLTMQ